MREVSSGEVGNKKKKDEDKKEEVRDEDSSSSDSDSGSESDSSESSASTASSNMSSGSSSSQESDGGENDASRVNGHPSPSRAENGTSAVPVEAGVIPVETGVVPDEAEEGDPTSSDSDDSDENDDEWAEVSSSSGEEQPDGAVDIHSNAAILQNAQSSSLSNRSKKSELDPGMNGSLAMPNSSTVSASSIKENDQISRANASGAAVSVLETPAPVSGVADATASAAATDAVKKKRPLSPGSMSKSLGIDVLIAPKISFRKPKVTEEKEPDNKRARLSEPEKSSNKKQTGADHSRSWSDTVSRQNGYQPHHPPQDVGDSFDDYNNFNYNGPVNQRPKWTNPDAVAQTGYSQMDLDPYPDPRPQDRQKETDASTSTGTGRSRGYAKAAAQWGAQLMPGNKPRDDPTERLHGNRNNYDYQLSKYKNNFNRPSRDRRAGSRDEGGRDFRGHGSRDRERFERHRRAMSTQTDEKTVQKVDASMQATTGWIEFCGAKLDNSSVYKLKAKELDQLGNMQPSDSLPRLRLKIEASIYYIQEAFALEVETADAKLVLSKLADVLKFCKVNDVAINKNRVATDDPDMPWTILLVLNTRIMSYLSKKLYLVRQKEMDDAKQVFDTYFMSGGSPSPTTSQISPAGSNNSTESMAKSGNKEDKSDRVITAQIHNNLEIYIKYADYSRKSDQYYMRADGIVSKYPKVQQFYDRLEFQYREFLPIRPIGMFANYCLAAIASLAKTKKS